MRAIERKPQTMAVTGTFTSDNFADDDDLPF